MAEPSSMLRTFALAGMCFIALGGCSDSLPSLPKVGDLNPFKEKPEPLPGRRIPVMPPGEKIPGELADASQPITLPAPVMNEDWTQPGGDAANAPGHLALSGGVREAWSASAGTGSGSVGRVTARPIVYGGRVYTLDADGKVSAFSVSGGSQLWRHSLEPTPTKTASSGGGFGSISTSALLSLGGSDGGGYGGGLAAESGRIYGASGYGAVIAMDPASGKRLWEKSLGAPVRSSPTVSADRVFVLTTEGRFYCLSAVDGSEIWSARGLPHQASLALNASPAVAGDVVVVPYPTGDVVGLKTIDGTPVWSESLTRSRGVSQIAQLSDAARPVVVDGIAYAIGHGGRMVASNAQNGERLWSINVAGTQAPWVAGDSVFIVDTSGQVMAVSRRDGKVQWTSKLPTSGAWSGPVLANGSLWLVSSKGTLASVEATTGRLLGQQSLSEGSYVPPVVAGGRMYLITIGAKLIALN